MNDDYLWDRSGEADPDVRKLEKLLARYRHNPSPPARRPQAAGGRRWKVAVAAAAAAVLVLLGGAGAWLALRPAPQGWEVERLAGVPQVGGADLTAGSRMRVGQWLRTDSTSRARLHMGGIGEVEVGPDSMVRLDQATEAGHRLSLTRGLLHARIWASPLLFAVQTPSAVAIDLGCEYTLEVDTTGAGLLRVTMGWVALERDGRESFVPAGAFCLTRTPAGPGTPCFADAPEALRSAVVSLDYDPLGASERSAALRTIISRSRPRDALTLWHLLARTQGEDRARVFDGLAALAPPPPGVTREGVLGGKEAMIEAWWGSLGMGEAAWWRLWRLEARR